MEQIVRNVRDIDAEHRSAIEHVVGQTLRENQQLVIQIANVDDGHGTSGPDTRRPQTLAEWTTVYEGLSEQQIDAVDATINSRANLTRNLP